MDQPTIRGLEVFTLAGNPSQLTILKCGIKILDNGIQKIQLYEGHFKFKELREGVLPPTTSHESRYKKLRFRPDFCVEQNKRMMTVCLLNIKNTVSLMLQHRQGIQ